MTQFRGTPVLLVLPTLLLLAQPAAQAQEEKFGRVNFLISCSAAAQTQFNRAVAMLHSFFFPETVKAFTALAAQEPSCAMAYWGIAISQRPNPLVAPFPPELMKNGWQAIEQARAASAKSQRESDWIEALAAFFKDYDSVDLRKRTLAYEAAMERLTARYPDDSEAAVFYALALNEAIDLNDKTYAKQFKAAAILQAIEAKQPDHPGVPHYLIHSYDFAPICRDGLPAAQRYAELAPAAPHALHMPSHTFSMLGMWEESIAANVKPLAASRAYAMANKLDGTYAAAPHSYDFMQYAYLQLGQDSKARAIMAEAAAIEKGCGPILGREPGLAAVPARTCWSARTGAVPPACRCRSPCAQPRRRRSFTSRARSAPHAARTRPRRPPTSANCRNSRRSSTKRTSHIGPARSRCSGSPRALGLLRGKGTVRKRTS